VQKQPRGFNSAVVIWILAVPARRISLDHRLLLLYTFTGNHTTETGNVAFHEVTMTRYNILSQTMELYCCTHPLFFLFL